MNLPLIFRDNNIPFMMQMVGVVEKANAASTQNLKLNIDDTFTNWHEYLNLATTLLYTSYHTSVECVPTVLFHRRDPVKPRVIRCYSNYSEESALGYDFVESFRDEMLKKMQNAEEANSFNRCRRYYDRKIRVNPHKLQLHCLFLNPNLTEHSGSCPKVLQKMLA